MIALYDSDKVRDLFHLPKDACRRQIVDAARKECGPDHVLVLLEDNMEALVRAICDLVFVEQDTQYLALERKKLNERDIILRKMLARSEAGRNLRQALLDSTPVGPSLKYLVKKIVECSRRVNS